MATAKLKVDEWQEKFMEAIQKKQWIDDFSFRAALRDIGDGKSSQATFARGLAYCANGDFDGGLNILAKDVFVADAQYARIYCFLLEWKNDFEELEKVIFLLADKHKSKWLFFKAASVAYALGNLDKLEAYMGRFMKMLSEDEGKASAEALLAESLFDLNTIYNDKLCTQEQLRCLGLAVHRVLSKSHSSTALAVSIGADPAVGYLVDIEDTSPEKIARLNIELAEEICSMESLDDCKLIARFSFPVKRNAGSSYVYK
ncbi:MAG: hypothetical protein ACTIOQ_23290 [Serratia grimesii]|uniref:hypothetical protein n=1 Tax=Serratia grimesii TaxID=82995 RepID=UPI003F964F26